MNDTTLDAYTTHLLTGQATLPGREQDGLCQKIAADTLAFANPVAWREISARLAAAGVSGRQLPEAMRMVWVYRKGLRQVTRNPGGCASVST